MKSITKASTTTLLCILAVLVSACHSDEDPTSQPTPLAPFREVVISETKQWPSVPSNKVTEAFQYDIDGKLTSHTVTQNISDYTYETIYLVEYDGNTATITDNDGSSWTYTLNKEGMTTASAFYRNNRLERE